jgi:MurNAc alpha-1-phosphate uridylyltransferase
MILAAGRGERMRPLTDTVPKALLPVHGKPLIEWHLIALARAGVRQVVVNTAWLEEQMVAALGDGARWGVSIVYSMEGRAHGGALETAGGIATALPLLVEHADDPFWLVSADIYAPGFRFDHAAVDRFAADVTTWAHLWLAPNPPFHPRGDFGIAPDGRAVGDDSPGPRHTYANLALCRPAIVAGTAPGTKAALGPLLFAAARLGRITAELYREPWENLGTPAQLAALNNTAFATPIAPPAR